MRRKILMVYALAILLGVLTGIIGSLLQIAISVTTQGLVRWFAFCKSHGLPVGLVSALTCMFMIFAAWLMVKWFSHEAAGSGVQEIEGALLHERPIFWRNLLPVKFIGGVLSISANLVVGREGPTIQIGGNLGAMLSDWFQLTIRRRDALIAAGAAAGLATAFNAPLAGILFVIEEMRNEFNFSFTNFKVVAICCVMATIVMHMILGAHPAIPMDVFELPSLQSLWLFFLFGVMVGFLGLVFNIVLMKSLFIMDTLSSRSKNIYVLCIGLLVGYLAYVFPETVGGGYNIIERALTMTPTATILLVLVVVRFITTILSYNTGVPGGIFAPMLAMGSLLGLAASYGFQVIMNDASIHSGMFAVAGMGALFSAVVRAPVTGIVLVVEMTQNYSLILPLMVSCLTSTTIVQLANNPPIYTQLLHRTLKKQRAIEALK